MAQYASHNLKANRALIIGDNSSDYAKGLTKSFKETFEGEVVGEENFVAKEKDFKAMLTKVKNKEFDFIYLPAITKKPVPLSSKRAKWELNSQF